MDKLKFAKRINSKMKLWDSWDPSMNFQSMLAPNSWRASAEDRQRLVRNNNFCFIIWSIDKVTKEHKNTVSWTCITKTSSAIKIKCISSMKVATSSSRKPKHQIQSFLRNLPLLANISLSKWLISSTQTKRQKTLKHMVLKQQIKAKTNKQRWEKACTISMLTRLHLASLL